MLEFSKRFSNEIWNVFSYLVKSRRKNSWHQTDRISNFIAAKNEEHDDMLKDINLYHINLEFIVIFLK